MSQYSATVSREGKWWMVRVPAIDGLTQARRFAEVELMARELIAVTLGVPLGEVTVTVSVEPLGGIEDVAGKVARIAEDRAQAAELAHRASRDAIELASALRGLGIPGRDIGALLGMSHQRAHQLVGKPSG
ncbi:MAG: hypothetical protein ABL886_14365, partial [Rhodoglobus sp.]